jgi:molybdate-binding protein/DNA-binding XRE family transcriptional regulator
MMMSTDRPLPNRVKQFRLQRGWSQEQLAGHAGISRAAVSAIEIQRLVPSVAAALALARAFGCPVEDLFGTKSGPTEEIAWAWPPESEPCRFWQARAGGSLLHFPSEPTVAGILPHDGVFSAGECRRTGTNNPERTLVMACCDPAAGLLAQEYERTTGFRLLPLHRTSRQGLDLLHRGLIDVAGIHLATVANEGGNASEAGKVLGDGYSLLRFATWQEGVATHASVAASSLDALLRSRLRWVGREAGAGARYCQDEILAGRPVPRRTARDHRGVAEAIRSGWADVGVCLQLASEEARLKFFPVREEVYDLCFRSSLEADPRVRALVALIRTPAFRTLFSALPGCKLARDLDVRHIEATA